MKKIPPLSGRALSVLPQCLRLCQHRVIYISVVAVFCRVYRHLSAIDSAFNPLVTRFVLLYDTGEACLGYNLQGDRGCVETCFCKAQLAVFLVERMVEPGDVEVAETVLPCSVDVRMVFWTLFYKIEHHYTFGGSDWTKKELIWTKFGLY